METVKLLAWIGKPAICRLLVLMVNLWKKVKTMLKILSGDGLKIKIRFFAELREIVGEREKILAFPDSHVNIAKLLNFLVDVYGEKFKEKIFDKNGQLFNHYITLFWLTVKILNFLKV